MAVSLDSEINKLANEVSNLRTTIDVPTLFRRAFGSRTLEDTAVSKDSHVYNMTHENRGKCLIFNHKNFEDPELKERKGTDVDAKNLVNRFQELKFDVKRYDDSKTEEVLSIIEDVSRENHENYDCIAVCYLSHGKEGIVSTKDGEILTEDIFKNFREENCPSLAGKPKLFFIQACRGVQLMEGIEIEHTDNYVSDCVNRNLTHPDVSTIPGNKSMEEIKIRHTENVVSGCVNKNLTHPDFLVAYSTVSGFYSWRNPDNGSWFVQGLSWALKYYGNHLDLLEILTMVNRQVAYYFESNAEHPFFDKKKIVPFITSTLTRKVCFPPKPSVQ